MPVVTRKVKGSEYVYYREWLPESKEHHDEYLGKKGEKETERKALMRERETILKQMNAFQQKLTEIDASLNTFSVGEKIGAHPFVKWAGGKTQLMERMSEYFPTTFNRYWEPFLGGGAVFFYLASNKPAFPATLSDTNHDLINAYEAVRDGADELIKSLNARKAEFEAQPTKAQRNEHYIQIRGNPPDIDSEPTDRASWFIFLNKTAFNGLYRVNSSGGYNVPYGDYTKPSFFEKDNILNISKILNRKDIEIVWADYTEVLLGKAGVREAPKEGDFCYLDPPYYSEDNKGFTAYSASRFTKQDQEKLADVFKTLTERKVKVLLSNSKSDFIEGEFRKREVEGSPNTYDSLTALRVINCKGSNRTGVKELLIKNY